MTTSADSSASGTPFFFDCSPITGPAYPDNPEARARVDDVLSVIARCDKASATAALDALQADFPSDRPEELLLFDFLTGLTGFCCTDPDLIRKGYGTNRIARCSFYLPFFHLAALAHGDHMYAAALQRQEKAERLLNAMPDTPERAFAQTALHLQKGRSLAMMYRIDEAVKELILAAGGGAPQKSLDECVILLMVAVDQLDDAEELLNDYADSNDTGLQWLRDTLRRVREGTHPHFCELPVDKERLSRFWQQFTAMEKNLRFSLMFGGFQPETLKRMLRKTFPFLTFSPEFTLRREGSKTAFEFCHHFSVAYYAGLEALLDACPEELRIRWDFSIARDS